MVIFLQEGAEPAFQLKAELTELSDDDPSAVALQPAAGLQPAKSCSKRKRTSKLVPADVRAKLSRIVWSVCQCRAKAAKSKSNCLEQFRSESCIDDLTSLNLRLRRLAKFDMDVEAWVWSLVTALSLGVVRFWNISFHADLSLHYTQDLSWLFVKTVERYFDFRFVL